jgi:hypothetical protein
MTEEYEYLLLAQGMQIFGGNWGEQQSNSNQLKQN